MAPEIMLGSLKLPSFYTLLITGFVVASAMAIYLRPANFPIKRTEILFVSMILLAFGLVGARMLFILLRRPALDFNIPNIFSLTGGYAYFGSLILSIIALMIYAKLRKVRFLALADYVMPFLLFSQLFVRIGCLLAGCCYGKPTDCVLGVTFKSVDSIARHPTQAYEMIFLFFIYIIGRRVYKMCSDTRGLTSAVTILMYGSTRFFNEYLRTDSPVIFLNITIAQAACIGLAVLGFICSAVMLRFHSGQINSSRRTVSL